MTLSAIKSMFVPGAYWKVEYSNPEMLKARPFRQVHKISSNDLVWSVGSVDRLYTRWPKASEIVSSSHGRLEFRYAGQSQTFTFTMLTTPEEIQQAASHIDSCAKADADARAEKARESAETKARLDAEYRNARDNKFRTLQPVAAHELIEAMREHGLTISPGTIGALRKKQIHNITQGGWSYISRNRPRFTYETQPSILYMRVHDHLLLQDLGTEEEIRESLQPDDPDINHLFGSTLETNVTPQPLKTDTPSALDLFAA